MSEEKNMPKKESNQGTRRDFRAWLDRNAHVTYTEYSRMKTEDKKEIYNRYIRGIK